MKLLLALGIFLVMAMGDFIWVRYTIHLTRLHAWQAALYAALIIIAGMAGVEAYVKNPIYVIPAALGAATGTYLTIRLSR